MEKRGNNNAERDCNRDFGREYSGGGTGTGGGRPDEMTQSLPIPEHKVSPFIVSALSTFIYCSHAFIDILDGLDCRQARILHHPTLPQKWRTNYHLGILLS